MGRKTLSVFDLALKIGLRPQLAHEINEDLVAPFSAEHLFEILFI